MRQENDPSRVQVPPLADFVSRRFAAESPPWSWLIFERIGGALAYLFALAGIPPYTVTMLGGSAGACGAVLLGEASGGSDVVLAGCLLLLSYSLDCADGQLARATGRSSRKGAWLDVVVDAVVIAFLTTGLCLALLRQGQPELVALLLAGAFGASRTASLFTSTLVRTSGGGMRLQGAARAVRAGFVALIDTPFIYAAVSASRLRPDLLPLVIVGVTGLTVVQTLVSAQRHFASEPPTIRSHRSEAGRPVG